MLPTWPSAQNKVHKGLKGRWPIRLLLSYLWDKLEWRLSQTLMSNIQSLDAYRSIVGCYSCYSRCVGGPSTFVHVLHVYCEVYILSDFTLVYPIVDKTTSAHLLVAPEERPESDRPSHLESSPGGHVCLYKISWQSNSCEHSTVGYYKGSMGHEKAIMKWGNGRQNELLNVIFPTSHHPPNPRSLPPNITICEMCSWYGSCIKQHCMRPQMGADSCFYFMSIYLFYLLEQSCFYPACLHTCLILLNHATSAELINTVAQQMASWRPFIMEKIMLNHQIIEIGLNDGHILTWCNGTSHYGDYL